MYQMTLLKTSYSLCRYLRQQIHCYEAVFETFEFEFLAGKFQKIVFKNAVMILLHHCFVGKSQLRWQKVHERDIHCSSYGYEPIFVIPMGWARLPVSADSRARPGIKEKQ